MSEPNDADRTVGEPAVIIFGRDDSGKPHASTFDASAADLAERAAGLMRMRVLRITTDEHRAAASGLPAGRIFSSGRAFVPFVKKAAYEALEAFGEAFDPPAPTEAAEPADEMPAVEVTNIPGSWSDIKPGSLVLAAVEPTDPWYPAVVIEARDNDIFLLRWRDWPTDAGFARRRDHLSLFARNAASL